MEKVLVVLMAVLMMLGFSMVGFASDQNTAGTHKEAVMTYRGEVTTFDQTAHTIVVKGKEGEKTFDVSQATMKGQIEPEHYVAVKYTETNGKMVASSVMAVSHKASSNMKKLSSAENALYSGIGDAMIWGWVTSKSCSA